MTEEKKKSYDESSIVRYSDKNNGTYFSIKLEKVLDNIARDIKSLPCQGKIENCPQEKHMQQLREVVKELEKETAGERLRCQEKVVVPLREQTNALNIKQDIQQQSLNDLTKGQKNIYQEIHNLGTKLTNMSVISYTKKETKKMIMDVIKWVLGILVASFSIYYGILAVFGN